MMEGNAHFSIENTYITAELSVGETGNSNSHFHIYHEVHFVLEGNCVINTPESDYVAQKGDVIIIPSNVIHDIKNCENNFRRCVIGFSLEKTNDKNCKDTYGEFFMCFKEIKNVLICRGDFENLVSEVLMHSMKDDLYNLLSRREYLKLIFLKLADTLSNKNIKKEVDTSENYLPVIIIEQYLTKEYSNPEANLKDLAKLLNLSTKHAERTISQLTGSNFKKLLSKRRMSEAKELVERTNLKLSEIAQKTGYNSYESFYRAFVNYYNKSPKEFRN